MKTKQNIKLKLIIILFLSVIIYSLLIPNFVFGKFWHTTTATTTGTATTITGTCSCRVCTSSLTCEWSDSCPCDKADECTISSDCEDDTHTECFGGGYEGSTCESVPGAGTNECTWDGNCFGSHDECDWTCCYWNQDGDCTGNCWQCLTHVYEGPDECPPLSNCGGGGGTTTPTTSPTTTSTTVDPCAGVICTDGWENVGSSYACCDGNSKCTTCQDQEYRDHYCGVDGSCDPYTITNTQTLKSGCSDCTGDGWYDKGSSYACCDLTDPDTICTCQDQEERDYYCSGGSCTYNLGNTQTIRSNCNDCGYCKTCYDGACIDKPGVIGTVTNVSLENIKGAEVNILGLDKSDTTDASGNYFICEFPAGTYDIVASKNTFSPLRKDFTFDGSTMVTRDFVLYTAGSECQQDCSKTSDEIPVCHMDCEGINGCHFYDDTLMNICTRNGEMIGVPVGNTVSYNETYKATCCKGIPYLYKKIPGTSLVFPESENHVRITRIVFFRGQFARMIVDMFK